MSAHSLLALPDLGFDEVIKPGQSVPGHEDGDVIRASIEDEGDTFQPALDAIPVGDEIDGHSVLPLIEPSVA